MSYFVTGATGFIGRNLVELLLERNGTVYVLVREGSKGRLEELRNRWGVDESRVVGVVGDLSQPRLGISDEDIAMLEGNVDHLFHLAAIYDMKADAESQRVANVEGTRHMVQLAEAVEAGRVHMVSSIAAAGLYKGTWREDMFEEATDVDNHPYFQTKHESEGVVREECSRPWRVYRPGHRRRPLRDGGDGQGRRPVLLLQADPPDPLDRPAVGADPRGRGPRDQHRPGRLRRPRDGSHRPQGRLGRSRLQPHRSAPAQRRRGHRHLRPRRRRAAVVGPAAGRRHRGARAGRLLRRQEHAPRRRPDRSRPRRLRRSRARS